MHDSPQLNVPVHNIACFLFNDYQMVINQSLLEAGYCASKALGRRLLSPHKMLH